jgi:hypothetical protein
METKPAYLTRSSCRLCDGKWLVQFLDLGTIHLSDFLLPTDPPNPRVPLRLAICSSCGLIQLMETTDPDLLYRRFWYRSGTNYTMANEMKRLVDLAKSLGPSGPGAEWLDIGANDGTLLSYAPAGTLRIAVEPAMNLRDDLSQHCDELHSDYFHAGQIEPCDAIFTAAMFYDLDDPAAFTHDIRKTLKPEGIWINQLSYTPTMFETGAFDNACHEHLCYYTLATLERLYGQCGLKVLDVSLNGINGGSMCVVATHESSGRKPQASVPERRSAEYANELSISACTQFARKVRQWKESATKMLDYMAPKRIHIYGASTKGNTLLQYLEATRDWFEFASDRNPDKWGRITAGSRIPIIGEGESRLLKPEAYFVLPWAFKEEFVLREANYLRHGGKLIFPLPELSVVTG